MQDEGATLSRFSEKLSSSSLRVGTENKELNIRREDRMTLDLWNKLSHSAGGELGELALAQMVLCRSNVLFSNGRYRS